MSAHGRPAARSWACGARRPCPCTTIVALGQAADRRRPLGERHARRGRRPRGPAASRRSAGAGATGSSPSTKEASHTGDGPSASRGRRRTRPRAGPSGPSRARRRVSRTTCLSSAVKSPSRPARNGSRPRRRARTRSGWVPRPRSARPACRSSISRMIRFASSTGCRPLRNVLAKSPSTRPPRRRSKSRRFGIFGADVRARQAAPRAHPTSGRSYPCGRVRLRLRASRASTDPAAASIRSRCSGSRSARRALTDVGARCRTTARRARSVEREAGRFDLRGTRSSVPTARRRPCRRTANAARTSGR